MAENFLNEVLVLKVLCSGDFPCYFLFGCKSGIGPEVFGTSKSFYSFPMHATCNDVATYHNTAHISRQSSSTGKLDLSSSNAGVCTCVQACQPRSCHQFVSVIITNKLKQWFSCFCCSAVSPVDLTDLSSDSSNWKPLEDADSMWSTLRGRGKRASGDGGNGAPNTAATKKPPVPTRGSVKESSASQKRSEVHPAPCCASASEMRKLQAPFIVQPKTSTASTYQDISQHM